MHSLSELRSIPDGTPVTVHLINSAIGSPPETREILADTFSLLPRSGRRNRIGTGHVGRATEIVWRRSLASDRVQHSTRYAFVETPNMGDTAGGTGPASAGPRNGFSMKKYDASGGPSAELRSSSGSRVRIEAQRDGKQETYGFSWSSSAGPKELLDALRPLDPKVSDGFIAFSDRKKVKFNGFPSDESLEEENRQVAYLRLNIGKSMMITWLVAGPDDAGVGQVAVGGKDFRSDLRLLHPLVSNTAVPDIEDAHKYVVGTASQLLVRS